MFIRKELERAVLSIFTPYATDFTENRKNAEFYKNESLSFNMYFFETKSPHLLLSSERM